MSPKRKKMLFVAAKLTLALVLLAWVFSGVRWKDYVKLAEGGAICTVENVDAADGAIRAVTVRRGYWGQQRMRLTPEQIQPLEEKGQTMLIRPGLGRSLAGVHLPLLVLGFCGAGGALLFGGARLWYLLTVQDIHPGLWEVIRLSFLGQFFNMFVPGTVGGDLIKAYYLAQHTPKKAAVLVTMLTDRLIGLAELSLLAGVLLAVVLASGAGQWETLQVATWTAGAALVGVVGGLGLLLSSRVRRWLGFRGLVKRLPMARTLLSAGQAAQALGRRPGVMVVALGITLMAHICFIGGLAVMGFAVGVRPAWYLYFVYCPIIYIIGAVPLTPGGVGLVEAAYREFFTPFAPVAKVLTLALMARMAPMLWGLPGVVVALRGTRLPEAQRMEAELAPSTPPEEN